MTLKQQQGKLESHAGWECSARETQPGSRHALDFTDLGDIQLPPEQPQPRPFLSHTIWSTETPDFLVSRPYKKQHSFSCLLYARPSQPLQPLSPLPLGSRLGLLALLPCQSFPFFSAPLLHLSSVHLQCSSLSNHENISEGLLEHSYV